MAPPILLLLMSDLLENKRHEYKQHRKTHFGVHYVNGPPKASPLSVLFCFPNKIKKI
jgi:hypothetical protein